MLCRLDGGDVQLMGDVQLSAARPYAMIVQMQRAPWIQQQSSMLSKSSLIKPEQPDQRSQAKDRTNSRVLKIGDSLPAQLPKLSRSVPHDREAFSTPYNPRTFPP